MQISWFTTNHLTGKQNIIFGFGKPTDRLLEIFVDCRVISYAIFGLWYIKQERRAEARRVGGGHWPIPIPCAEGWTTCVGSSSGLRDDPAAGPHHIFLDLFELQVDDHGPTTDGYLLPSRIRTSRAHHTMLCYCYCYTTTRTNVKSRKRTVQDYRGPSGSPDELIWYISIW